MGSAILGLLIGLAAFTARGAYDDRAFYQDLEKQYPFYQAIRENDPDVYAKLRVLFEKTKNLPNTDAFIDSGIMPQMKEIISQYIQDKVLKSDDATVMEYWKLTSDELKAGQAKSPATCTAMLNGDGYDVRGVFPPDLTQREFAFMEKVARAPALANPSEMSPAEWSTIHNQVALLAAKKANVPEGFVYSGAPVPPPGDCAMAIEATNLTLALPPEKAASYYRHEMQMAQLKTFTFGPDGKPIEVGRDGKPVQNK